MAVTIESDNLSTQFGPANVPAVVRLTGGTTGRKYVVQIRDARNNAGTPGNLLADLRQPHNQGGRAVFDIATVLQSYAVVDNDPALEYDYNYVTLKQAPQTTAAFHLYYGEEDANGNFDPNVDGTYYGSPLIYTNGRMLPQDYSLFLSSAVDLWINPLMPLVSGGSVIKKADLVTDLYKTQWGQLKGPKPNYGLTDTTEVYHAQITAEDYYTFSFQNLWHKDSTGTPATKTIQQFTVAQFSGVVPVGSIVIQNTDSNGGGPTTGAVHHPYNVITLECGPGNFPMVYNPAANWIVVTAQINTGGEGIELGYDYVFLEVVDGNCLDYDPIQLSWMNSYGFRDYYTFKKKNERQVQIKRNTFDQDPLNYNINVATSDAEWNLYKNGTTVYSQSQQETITMTTDWLTDEEAQYLENLYRSGSVRMRTTPQTAQFIGDLFVPVVVQNMSYTEKNYKKDKLFQYEVTIKLATGLSTQRGF